MFYRFNNGVFVEAETFEQAQEKLINDIRAEKEDPKNWSECTCLGLSHRPGCPAMEDEIPY